MINALITAVFKVVLMILKFIADILLSPLTLLLSVIFPDLSDFLSTAQYFISHYLINAIGVGREIFLNITGFPHSLIVLSVNATLIFFTYIGTVRVITFVKSIWRTFKGGK